MKKLLLLFTSISFFVIMLTGCETFLKITGIQKPDPPPPKVQYAEFPFTLTYEIDGQKKIINDTLIIEFDGYSPVNESSWQRSYIWKERYKSGESLIILLAINEFEYVYYNTGPPHYYMGEETSYPHTVSKRAVWEKYNKINNKYESEVLFPDELLQKYQIKIISFEIAPPIENDFSGNY
jgi:hypothetical protein